MNTGQGQIAIDADGLSFNNERRHPGGLSALLFGPRRRSAKRWQASRSSAGARGPRRLASMASASAAQPESRAIGAGLVGARALAYRRVYRGARVQAGAVALRRTPAQARLPALLVARTGSRGARQICDDEHQHHRREHAGDPGRCALSAAPSSHKRRPPVLMALQMGSAALAMTAAAVKRQRCNCATAPPWWISP